MWFFNKKKSNWYAEDILSIIENATNGIKAKDIAKKLSFALSKKKINSLLYGELSDNVYVDDDFRWFISKTVEEENESENNKLVPDLDSTLKAFPINEFVDKSPFLSERTKNSLKRGISKGVINIETLGELVSLLETEDLLMSLPNFGKSSKVNLIESIENFSITGVLQKNNFHFVNDADTEELQKNIDFIYFVSNSPSLTIRTKNALNKGIQRKEIIIDKVADAIRTLLDTDTFLKLQGLGKSGVDNLVDAINNIGKDFSKNPIQSESFQTIDEAIKNLISNFTEVEQDIIESRFEQNLSLVELGLKKNVTRERIRQVEARVLKKLKLLLENHLSNDTKEETFKKIDSVFFHGNSKFLSKSDVTKLYKKINYPFNLFLRSYFSKIPDYLSNNFFYYDKHNGWYFSEDLCDKSSNLSNNKESQGPRLDNVIKTCNWPIQLSELSEKMNTSDMLLIDKLNKSGKYTIDKNSNGTFVVPSKLSISDCAIFILRMQKEPMKLEEIQNDIDEIFDMKANIHAIDSALNNSALTALVDSGTHTLMENIDINSNQLGLIKEFSKKLLQAMNVFVSSSVIYREMSKLDNFYSDFGNLISEYLLISILKNDKNFVAKRGNMVGLNNEEFIAKYVSLTEEIINLLKKEDRSMTADEICDSLSATRVLSPWSLQSNLTNEKNKLVFEQVGNRFRLISNRKSEIDIEDFLGVDF